MVCNWMAQGVGAWNRQVASATLGKRERVSAVEPEPPRKLRRTASAKLGSQSETIWGDIAGGSSETSHTDIQAPLRPSKSMPVMQTHANQSTKAVEPLTNSAEPTMRPETPRTNFFQGKLLHVSAFDRRKTEALENIIVQGGGSISDLGEPLKRDSTNGEPILVVPHTLSRAQLSASQRLDVFPNVVTELWIEACIAHKAFIPPKSYPPGGILDSYPAPYVPFSTINCTGFEGLEVLHIMKMVTLLGAKYEETFRKDTSLLICKRADLASPKILHAQEWEVPIVSYKWLYTCIQTSMFVPIDKYQIVSQHRRGQRLRDPPGADFVEPIAKQQYDKHASERNEVNTEPDEKRGFTFKQPVLQGNDIQEAMPLNEISNNSPTRSHQASPLKPKSLVKSFDGPGSSPKHQSQLSSASPHKTIPQKTEFEASKGFDAQALNGAIQELLNMKAMGKPDMQNPNGQAKPTNRKLLGRALSNLSNSSLGSTKPRASRASSVDSLNTDGLGSEITLLHDDVRQSHAAQDGDSRHSRKNYSFSGRAKQSSSHATDSITTFECGNDARDLDPYYGNSFPVEEQKLEPPRTQLGYQGSEEAVKLREKLERRQGKFSADQSTTTKGLRSKLGSAGRIKDDDTLLANGAGAVSRRTRGREKEISPPGLKDF